MLKKWSKHTKYSPSLMIHMIIFKIKCMSLCSNKKKLLIDINHMFLMVMTITFELICQIYIDSTITKDYRNVQRKIFKGKL